MSKLAYNPADYDKDLRYLIGLHYNDVVAYMASRFPKNAHAIRVVMQNIVQGYISNMSNIYTAGVEYVGVDSDKYGKMLRRKNRAMKQMEQFYNYQKMALLWTYLVKDEPYFMALDGSNYYVDYDSMGNVAAVLVRTGRFLDPQGEIKYHFKLWRDGAVYHATAKDWTYINTVPQATSALQDGNFGGWVPDPVNERYTRLPFTLIKNPFVVQPDHSTLIELENEYVSGHGYMIMSALISLIAKFAIISNGDGPAIQKMVKDLGISTKAIHLGKQGDEVKMIQAISTDNHMNYTEIQQKIIMLRGQIDGVDKQALFPINQVQSGVAMRLQNGTIMQKREDRILEWEEFEDEHWDLVQELTKSRIKAPTDYNFAPLPNQFDPTELAEIEDKKFQTLQAKYNAGTITTEQFVRGANPDADDATVAELVAAKEGAAPVRYTPPVEEPSDQNMNEGEDE